MKNLLVVPMLAVAMAVASVREADAGWCGAACFNRCGSCCSAVDYCGCRQQCCTVMKTCKEVVYEKQDYTCYKTVYETGLREQDDRLREVRRRDRYRNCEYTVCKPVWETKTKTFDYTVCKPVYETKTKDICYTVCKPVYETKTQRHLLHRLQAGLRNQDQ